MKATQKTKRTPKPAEDRTPETIEERVHRHISDINSKITDDDIKSVRTELDIRRSSDTEPQKKNIADKKQKTSSRRDKKKDNEMGKKRQTPWDLLSDDYE